MAARRGVVAALWLACAAGKVKDTHRASDVAREKRGDVDARLSTIPLAVDGLDARGVVVHVLATAKHAKYKEGSGFYDYVDERLYGSAATWGRYVPRLTYVLGGAGAGETKLAAEGHATRDGWLACAVVERADRGALERSSCGGGAFEILRFRNCSNEYYGSKGPCCRCQESMRWALYREPELEWYVFQDDDMFVRVNALLAVLAAYAPGEPLAFSGGKSLRGFAPGMWKELAACDSNAQCTFKFPWMQPAVFSRAALQNFRLAVDANGLTYECDAFTVTHDVGLGILNWMARTPTVLLKQSFVGDGQGRKPDAIAVHGVRRHSGESTIGGLKGPSGGDGALQSHEGLLAHFAELDAKSPADFRRAGAAAARWRPVNLTGYLSANKSKLLPSAWETYAPGDCPRFDAARAAATCATEDAQATWRRLGGAAPGAVWVALAS